MLSLQQLQEKFNTSFDDSKAASSNGLSSAEAAKRLVENGLNQLSPPVRRHPFLKFLDILLGLFNLLLIIAGIASYIVYALDPVASFQNVGQGGVFVSQCFFLAKSLRSCRLFLLYLGIPWWHLDWCGLYERYYRVLPAAKICRNSRIFFGKRRMIFFFYF